MSILQDIRLAFRIFRRTPVPTAIALLSIALSVGATAVVFAAIKSVLIDPLPYARASKNWSRSAASIPRCRSSPMATGSCGMTPRN